MNGEKDSEAFAPDQNGDRVLAYSTNTQCKANPVAVSKGSLSDSKRGRAWIVIGWILISLQILVVVGAIGEDRSRDRLIEGILHSPTPEGMCLVVAFLVGWNSPSIAALLCGVALLRRKKEKGKAIVIAAIVILILSSLFQFLPTSASGTVSYTDWQEYMSKKHGFVVRFPGNAANYGPVVHYTHGSEAEQGASYNVFVNVYEKPLLTNKAIQAAFDAYIQGRMMSLGDKAKLLQAREVSFLGYPALDYEYTFEHENTTGYYKGLLFIVRELGYCISVACTEETKDLSYAKYADFVKSFYLTK